MEKTQIEKILGGIRSLEDVVSSTLGPDGKNVIIAKNGKTRITKDGVSVVKDFTSDDDFENVGISIVKDACQQTVNGAGDGTTSTTIWSYNLFKEALYEIERGNSPANVQKGLQLAKNEATKILKEFSKPIELDDVLKIATSSSNSEEIGKLIQEIYSTISLKGIVEHQKSQGDKLYYEIKEGYVIDRGFNDDRYLVNLADKEINYSGGCYVLVCPSGIPDQKKIIPLLNKAVEENRAILIIADETDPNLMNTYLSNKKTIKLCVINCPSYDVHRIDFMNDIIVWTDAKETIDNIWVGSCEGFISTKKETKLIGCKSTEERIEERISTIKERINPNEPKLRQLVYHERIGKLRGKLAILHVGAQTPIEREELYDRIDDAILNIKAAIDEGICYGGGYTYLSIKKRMNKFSHPNLEINSGIEAFKRTLECVTRKLISNSGYSQDLLKSIYKKGPYNFKTKKFKSEDVWDSSKSIKLVIENSTSVIGTLINSKNVIF